MASLSTEPRQLGEDIYQLVAEARESERNDRRTEVRYPFFRPVSLDVDGRRLTALSREISMTGIGLQHNFELPLGNIELTISSEHGYTVRVQSQVVWCQPRGEGWYLSGAQFIAIAGVRA